MSNLGRTVKTYVQVDVEFSDRGIMRPKGILWEDGQYLEIDKVLDIRSAPAAKAGGQGDRYTIRLGGQTTFLFFEHNTDYGSSVLGRWFVERKLILQYRLHHAHQSDIMPLKLFYLISRRHIYEQETCRILFCQWRHCKSG